MLIFQYILRRTAGENLASIVQKYNLGCWEGKLMQRQLFYIEMSGGTSSELGIV
jgi:hypothetical protein